MAYTKYVRNVLQDLKEEFASNNMTVKYKGIHEGNLLFSTKHLITDGHHGYPLYVLVDPKNPDIRAYRSDYDFKLDAAVEKMEKIKRQRKLGRAQKRTLQKCCAILRKS